MASRPDKRAPQGAKPARRPAADKTGGGASPRIALALAGGGPEGAVYEIGALRALDEAIEGIDLNGLAIYVGVSAGSFIASFLANGLDTARLCRAIVSHEPGDHPFIPETFLTPSMGEWFRGGTRLPRLLTEALVTYLRNPLDSSLAAELTRISRALPVGAFDNGPIRAYLEKVFDRRGRTNDFRELACELYVIAADLDSAKAVRFGEPGFDHVPISQAVEASSALPGLYPPVEIDGRFYVDGVLLKTIHASVALDAGAELLLAINPIVPVDTVRAVEEGVMKRGRLIDRGLPTILSQTFRTLIQSRLEAGMKAYEERYAGRDIVLFQPRRDDYKMFFTNIFSFEDRVAVAEHAYHNTLRDLRERQDELGPILERHGARLLPEVIADHDRDLWANVKLKRREHKGIDARRAPAPKPPRKPPELPLTDRLSATLDRLERLL